MPTAEEIGIALEEQAIGDAFSGNHSSYSGVGGEGQVYSNQELNNKLMSPEWDTSKLVIMKPKFSIQTVAIKVLDSDGNPVLHEGLYVVEEKELKVFEGWENKEIEVAGGNIFKRDWNTAILDNSLSQLINSMFNTRQFLIELSISTGEDYSYDIYKYTSVIGGILNTSKSKYGKTMELVKTDITKGEQTNIIRQMLLQDQKKRGIFGKIKGAFTGR